MYRLLALFALLFSIFSCGDSYSGSYAEAAEKNISISDGTMEYSDELQVEAPRTAEPPPPPNAQASPRPKIIYTASARARVENLDTALVRINRAVRRAGGYLSNERRTNSAYEHAVQLEIRIPAEQLNGTLALLPAIAVEIDEQSRQSRDVTAEWIDLETRLQTKRDVRDRYVEILRNRAQKVEDILNAEDKIRVITEEIEAKEGRLRYLRSQVAMSTLQLQLYETQEYRETGDTYTRSFGNKLLGSLAFGWEMIQDVLLLLVSIWPVMILLLGGLIWWRRR